MAALLTSPYAYIPLAEAAFFMAVFLFVTIEEGIRARKRP
jgi:hypothetical protein